MEFYQAVKSLTPDDDEADRNDDEDQGDGKDDAELAGPSTIPACGKQG